MIDIGTEEFDEFYLASRDRLARQIAALTGDSTEALDHVQEAFVRAWARWDRVGDLDDPEGWVRRVAHNLAVSRWRRARRLVLRARPLDRDAAPGITWDDEQGAVIAALATLARGPREAIVLHHLVGLRVDEVAAALDAPVGTVKSWLARGRRDLASALAPTTSKEPWHE